jgi:hypothetical protein
LEVRTDLLTVEAAVAAVLEAVKKRLFSISKHDLSAHGETLIPRSAPQGEHPARSLQAVPPR